MLPPLLKKFAEYHERLEEYGGKYHSTLLGLILRLLLPTLKDGTEQDGLLP